jgi:hypothetical protein
VGKNGLSAGSVCRGGFSLLSSAWNEPCLAKTHILSSNNLGAPPTSRESASSRAPSRCKASVAKKVLAVSRRAAGIERERELSRVFGSCRGFGKPKGQARIAPRRPQEREDPLQPELRGSVVAVTHRHVRGCCMAATGAKGWFPDKPRL